MRNFMRDEGGPLEFADQVADPKQQLSVRNALYSNGGGHSWMTKLNARTACQGNR
jgi:hypothetical protein